MFEKKILIGMVHLPPLPGTPFFSGDFEEIVRKVKEDVISLIEGGATGCLIQTVDRIYSIKDSIDPLRLLAVGKVLDNVCQITDSVDFTVGVQIMRNCLKSSLAVAKLYNGNFIRAETLFGINVTPHGIVKSNPLRTIEYKQKIDAGNIKIIADIKTRHNNWTVSNKGIVEVAKYARLVGADAVGVENFDDVNILLNEISEIKDMFPSLPVIVSGGLNIENAFNLFKICDGALVGNCIKNRKGTNVDKVRVRELVDIINET